MTAAMQEAVIIKGVGGFYYARTQHGEVWVLRAKGIFRRQHITPVVGDRIHFIPSEDSSQGWIEEILPRQNTLIRPPVANIGHLIFVLAPEPLPDMILLDTMLVMAQEQGIPVVIVLNKIDLDPSLADTIRAQYAKAGAPILAVSAKTGQGLHQLAKVLLDGICCFAGQSGVGKSTLLSAITGLTLQAGEISRKIARGKNTTRHAELLVKDGFQVLDTAGFSLLSLWENMEPVALQDYYPEFAPYRDQCRFQPCYHLSEPDCAVLGAMEAGELSRERVARYHQLLAKAKEAWRNRYE